MGVSDQQLVQELINITPTNSLDAVVKALCSRSCPTHCYHTITTSTDKCTRAISRYKEDKKGKLQQQQKVPPKSLPHSTCDSCVTHHVKDSCPVRQGHCPKTKQCLATGVTCDACGKMNHFKKQCLSTKPAGKASK
ncbi:hypothetical protein Pcinc_000039 [Petrolisthes cinctipes]|uniref:Uncharacterized protein n=1 Tax=Petrolisthes cinctipes TaxID=88211 RepID=A0AAE1GP29_PETCI|nr:hypothetical protein Pcinc_010571 [Petrolisthes cinctipes]KAK3896295.1 hypothetical protein Pcinc_000039 [Petrolisthes cinctipes]